MTTLEQMLTALVNGEAVEIEPRTRVEEFLKNCVDACGCEGLPTPRTRVEALLYQLAEKIAEGGGGGGLTEQEIEEYLNTAY
jgi:hypothetical protein